MNPTRPESSRPEPSRDEGTNAVSAESTARPGFIDARRRGLLQGMAVAAGAGVAGVAAASPSAEDAAQPVEAPGEGHAGYRETDHVRRYYAAARF